MMIISKCMLQNFREPRAEPRASRAEPIPGSAHGSALQLAHRFTSQAKPLLGSARAVASARLSSARLARDARRAGSALCQPCNQHTYSYL